VKPKLSIGLPVHNGERFLRQALDSLLGQSFGQIEVLICDNASTDRTPEIAAEYARADERVRIHRNNANIGGAPNFNLAFKLTSAPYFKWSAHDDVCRSDYLAECMTVLERDASVALCHSAVELIDEHGRVVRAHDEELPLVGSDCPAVRFRDLIFSDHWCTSMFGVMRRSLLSKTPLIARHVGSDRNLLAELGLLGRFHLVPRPLFQNRDHRERSVNATDVRSSERAAWFDPATKNKITLPYVRCWYEYLRAVRRAPLSPKQRSDCYRALAAWPTSNRWQLRQDVEHAARRVVSRLRAE